MGQQWQMEGGDRWGTNRQNVSPPLASTTTPWVYRKWTGGIVSHGTALDGAGNAYRPTWVSNLIEKLDVTSGAFLGSFNALNFVQSTPALSQDGSSVFIHAPRNFQFDPPGRLFKVNTTSMDFDWVFQTDVNKISDYEAASPTVGPDGDVVFGNRAGVAWRIDDVTGIPVWTTSGLGEITRTIVFARDDSRVFVAHGSSISALDYATGAVLWTRPLGSVAGAPGTAPDGVVVLGASGAFVFGINPTTGEIIWQKPTLGPVVAAPAFSNTGIAYVGGYDFRLNAFRTTDGLKMWSYTSNHELRSPPIVDGNGRIYFNSRIGQFTCLEPTGALVWAYNVGGDSRGPMSIGPDGTIYIGFNASTIYAMVRQQRTEFEFSRLSASIGTLSSGSLADVHISDNSYAVGRTPNFFTFSRTDPNIRLDLELDSPQKRLLSFELVLETNCTLGNSTLQVVELFNFNTNQFETVDSRPASGTDTSFSVNITSNATRFVNPGSGLLRMRLGWFNNNGPRIWFSSIDQAYLRNVIPDFVP